MLLLNENKNLLIINWSATSNHSEIIWTKTITLRRWGKRLFWETSEFLWKTLNAAFFFCHTADIQLPTKIGLHNGCFIWNIAVSLPVLKKDFTTSAFLSSQQSFSWHLFYKANSGDYYRVYSEFSETWMINYKSNNLMLSCFFFYIIAQKMKFSTKDFFSKCDQIRSFLLIYWRNP